MPRTARASVGGICYHVMNRGNARARVYHLDSDYKTFVELLKKACERIPMRILAYCLMPNHFHLLLRPFNFETLATYVYQFAKDELLEEAALPALLIVLAGIPPIIVMNAALRRLLR